MTRTNILSFIVVAAGIGAALATSVHSTGEFGPTYVTLQPSTPGSVESGHINVSGAVLASTFTAAGAVSSQGIVTGINSSYGAGVYGESTSSSAGAGVEGHGFNGVLGYGPNPGGIGVAGYGQEGGHFWSDGSTGKGIFAEHTNGGLAMWVRSSGIAAIFQGDVRVSTTLMVGSQSTPSATLQAKGSLADSAIIENYGSGRGLHVMSTGDTAIWADSGYGWAGLDARSGSTGGIGILGQAYASSGSTYGVNGWCASPTGWAIWAQGRMGASGTKSFRIDHPLDPENKYLLHYSSESPEPQNFYNGVVRTNARGEAWVQLPDYFESINRDFRYTLTVIENEDTETFVLAKVARKIQGNRFKIRTNIPNVEVSWEVKAIRNDLWVQRYGAPTISVKSETERGKYLHPELYGQPAERGQFYHADPVPAPLAHSSLSEGTLTPLRPIRSTGQP